MSVLKNVENKIKLVTITCGLFLFGCIIISLGSMLTARQMVDDAHKQIYVLDSNVPILVKQTSQEVTLDIEGRNRQTLWGGCTAANPKLLLNDT